MLNESFKKEIEDFLAACGDSVAASKASEASKRARTKQSVPPLLAQRLRRFRANRGWTLEQLATRAGVGESTIGRIERGGNPSRGVVRALAQAFSLSIKDLVGEADYS